MNNYNCLDLNIIKDQISELASIQEAKEYILNEQVIFNPLKIKQLSSETKEAMSLISKDINVQFSCVHNVNDLLEKTQKGIILDGIELKDCLVFHNHANRIKKIFSEIDEELNIKDYTDSININNQVYDRINECIDNSGEIKDNASAKLKEINKKIEELNKQLYSRAQQFIQKHSSSLQEQSIYLRENRVTFLIKNSDKNKYSGSSYGSSSSGLASYVEPGSFIEMNNEMITLLHDKVDETNRILKELSYLVSTTVIDYQRNFESLTMLNVIFAKANYGIKKNCIIPEFVEGNYFDFKDLCHPLLDNSKVVSNSYRLYEPYRGIVISGSNTGGKTVSLKAIGLSIVMSYLGIPIIASEAYIPFYKDIYVDIDDNQSIQDSLSTFSAHITNINNILNNANENSLILIDELISGTDPKEAQAISLAILDKIKQLKSIFVITTHFDDIKSYSYEDENILLSSVGFDLQTLKPTYKYHENSIGSSNALDIASRYFDDQSIIENSKRYVQLKQTKQDELLNKLSKQMEELNIEKTKIEELRKTNEDILSSLKQKEYDFEQEKNNIKQKYIEELNEYINDIKQKANDKLDEIKQKNSNVIKEIEELVEDVIVEEEVVFNVGDNVRIKENEQVGTIIELNNDRAIIDLKGMTIKTKVSDLTLMPKTLKKEVYVEKPRLKQVSKELNLVGERVEDALVLMEEYLDKANGAKLSSVKLIHGIGTGTLRKALRQRASKLSYVANIKDGDFFDGGSAVTIVEFK